MVRHTRCISCGRPIGHFWEQLERMVERGENIHTALNNIGVISPCCRANLVKGRE